MTIAFRPAGSPALVARPLRRPGLAMGLSPGLSRGLVLCLVLGLAACGSAPPPDWQMNAKGSAERASEAWLSGESAIEAVEFARARNEVARTARPDLVARLELLRCATRVAALDGEPCTAFDTLAATATPADQAYARYLAGQASASDAALLPPAHRPLAGMAAAAVVSEASAGTALRAMEDPLSRLVAAGVLFRRGLASPVTVAVAVETASGRGWRRPLLAWLQVQLSRAKAAGASDEVARIEQRIAVLLGASARQPTR